MPQLMILLSVVDIHSLQIANCINLPPGRVPSIYGAGISLYEGQIFSLEAFAESVEVGAHSAL